MASFNNLAMIEPWMFRSTAGDSWCTDAFARETESAALQQSLFSHVPQVNHSISSSFLMNQSDYCSSTATASTVTASRSGSEPGTPESIRCGCSLGVSIGKTTKRKPRASKRSVTTFIQADPANFRQMVQQVTGVKLEGNGKLPDATVVKPEALLQPFINKLQGLLPTLDTSAYLLEFQNSNTHRIPAASGSTLTGNGFSKLPAMSPGTGHGGDGIDFYSFSSFPTLESSI